jgi:hypothetical protein
LSCVLEKGKLSSNRERMTVSSNRASGLVVASATALCVAPSLLLNVAPNFDKWAISGYTDSVMLGMAVLQLVSVMVLALLPFRMARADWATRIWLAAVLALTLGINFLNLLDVTHSAAESRLERPRAVIAKDETLRARIEVLKKSRAGIPVFTATSEGQVAAASRAVASAEIARDLECKSGVADRCRARGADVVALRSAELALNSQRTMTAQAEILDTELAQKASALAALGPLPQHIDATADKLALLFGSSGEAISNWRPLLPAISAEVFAMQGPFIVSILGVLLAGGGLPALPRQGVPALGMVTRFFRGKPLRIAAPVLNLVAMDSTFAMPRKCGKQIGPSEADLASIRDWLAARTVSRRGADIQAKDAYSSYAAFCPEHHYKPVTIQRFGRVIRGEMKIKVAKKSNRTFYAGIAFKGANLRVVNDRQDPGKGRKVVRLAALSQSVGSPASA